MNYIKDKKRSNFKLTSLENLVRLKTNGPKKLKEFNTHYYAIEWSRSHLFSGDSKSKLRWNLSQMIQFLGQSIRKRKLEELSDEVEINDSDSDCSYK
jgi:LPS O-antigen subunit length determinant protein (WzzB/FepE family)